MKNIPEKCLKLDSQQIIEKKRFSLQIAKHCLSVNFQVIYFTEPLPYKFISIKRHHTEGAHIICVLNMLFFPLGLGMKKELQTLRDEIKTLASQIQRKLKSEYWWITSKHSVYFFVLFAWITLINYLSAGIESKKGEEDGKYIPINIRMQRTQVGL